MIKRHGKNAKRRKNALFRVKNAKREIRVKKRTRKAGSFSYSGKLRPRNSLRKGLKKEEYNEHKHTKTD